MAEYNFWDDRTHDECDENWCPIGCCYCLDNKYCYECEDYKDFMSFYMLYDNTLNTCDIANICAELCLYHCDCKWAGCWNCIEIPKYSQCYRMIRLAIDMIYDHLY